MFTIEDALQLPPAISVAQAGQVLGCSRATAYEYARAGRLKTIDLGGQKLVPTAWLLRTLEILPPTGETGDGFNL